MCLFVTEAANCTVTVENKNLQSTVCEYYSYFSLYTMYYHYILYTITILYTVYYHYIVLYTITTCILYCIVVFAIIAGSVVGGILICAALFCVIIRCRKWVYVLYSIFYTLYSIFYTIYSVLCTLEAGRGYRKDGVAESPSATTPATLIRRQTDICVEMRRRLWRSERTLWERITWMSSWLRRVWLGHPGLWVTQMMTVYWKLRVRNNL